MKKFMIISCLLIFVCGCDGDIEGQGSGVKEVRQFHDANGALVREVPYNEAGQIHGIVREWYPNGDFKLEIRYKNGKKDGPFKENNNFFKSLTEGNFKDNKIIGSVKTHNENGVLIKENIYDDKGILLKTISWYDNGQKKDETDYEDGYRKKRYVEYYENGQLESQDDGNGNSKYWYKNGQQKDEYNKEGPFRRRAWYENGQQQLEENSDGTERSWYKNGYIQSASTISNGEKEYIECDENGMLTHIDQYDKIGKRLQSYYSQDIQEYIKENGDDINDLCKTGFPK